MTLKHHGIHAAVLLALAGSAQAPADAPQRVEITGSAIRRIQSECALPVSFEPFAYNGSFKRYTALDWQTRWKMTSMLTLTAGVLNLTDKDPPRSFKSAGGGQQIGYDDRDYDPRGRSFYANLGLKF